MKQKVKKESGKKSEFNSVHIVASAAAAGITLLIFIAIGFWLGDTCDKYLASGPFGVMLGTVFGAILGLLSLIKQMLEKK